MTFFKIFKFPAAAGGGSARASRRHRDRTQKPDAGIGRRRWPGMLQGTHRGSAG
ncbi:unnamed protein product [Staurois parvus]|uniref:Uncharacterized protein n=1 Tax=Staurois parvus TaxID=386267 RepID=A0ABN9FRF0_9NEOB|nr:unnamed protein product [Staurois parvus]